ncbi:MAG: helix-turn-helix transcriptional regulator [Mycobacterium sp.]|nr:helix-turn-helix transcriptional regulator [Mycobacterium sp.]MCB0938677.1 helix-turn-helix transcriptional regulator [Mycobacterium sp.]
MAEKRNPLAATGETVRVNIRRLREASNLGYAELARRVKSAGRGIPELGLRRIEEGERRVDVDDLMALAAALEVSPIALLMPSTTHGDETTATAVGEVTAHRFWNWLTGEMPLTGDAPSAVFGFISRSVPDWLLGTDYKLVEAGLSPRKEYSVRRPDKVLNRETSNGDD